MKKFTLFAFCLLAFIAPLFAAPDFQIKKVDVAFISSPEYSTNPPIHQARAEKWMEVEVTFSAAPAFTDELTFNYYILFAKRLFVGHVTHVGIPGGTKGQELRSVAYVSPAAINEILAGQPLNVGALGQVSVTITKAGISAPIDVKSFKPGATGEWWATMKQEEGFVVNKSETPFAPLYWDRYVALKPAATH